MYLGGPLFPVNKCGVAVDLAAVSREGIVLPYRGGAGRKALKGAADESGSRG